MTTVLTRLTLAVYNDARDLRFGRPLAGQVPTRFDHLGAKDTANSDYRALEKIFAGRITPDDVLVDIGCGKGHVINYWLRQGFTNPIVGVELDADIAAQTRARVRRYSNGRILTGNALEVLPADGTLFYLYNPFRAHVMQQFAVRLEQLGRSRGGPLRILYNNCKYLAPFRTSPAWSVDLLDAAITNPYDPVADITFLDNGSGSHGENASASGGRPTGTSTGDV